MKPDTRLKEHSGYAWVLSRLDTASPLGYARSREPVWYGPGEEAALEEELERVSAALAWDRERREAAVHCLARFRDVRGAFRREAGAPMDVVELFEVKRVLLCLAELAQVCGSQPLPGLGLPDLSDLLDLLDPEGRRLPVFAVEPAFAPALGRIREEKKRAEEALRAAPAGEREGLLALRTELVRREDAAELDARRRLTGALLGARERFFAALDAVGHLDLVLAKAGLARKLGCVRPEIVKEPAVAVAGMTHPQVAEALAERGLAFTPVDLELERGAAVITGANMGGKSVSLRAVTLNLLLMHTGYFVFAGAMRAPLFHSVDLICADGQSVDRGLSSFGAEMKELDGVLRRGEGKFFFLAADEFARGTNPGEGAALAGALTEHLNGLNCVALLTTHYDGVSRRAKRHYRVAGLREGAAGSLEDLPRLMDYRLLPAPPGAPCPRDAVKVCRLLGLEEKWMESLEENG